MTITHSTDDLRRTITSENRASFFKGLWRAFRRGANGRDTHRTVKFQRQRTEDIGITHGEINYFVSNRTIDPRGI